MNVKTKYEIGDTVWIHGVRTGELTQGKVIKSFTLAEAGYNEDMIFYVVEIPTSIDPLLEIREWMTMSQDAEGPVGIWRRQEADNGKMLKFFKKHGLDVQVPEVPVDITSNVDTKPKKRYYRRKKK